MVSASVSNSLFLKVKVVSCIFQNKSTINIFFILIFKHLISLFLPLSLSLLLFAPAKLPRILPSALIFACAFLAF